MQTKPKQNRERRCLVSRECRPTSELLRFCVAPDGTLTPDLDENLPGRGLWVSARADKVAEAAQKGLFARAAKEKVTLPGDDLAALVADLLKKRLINRLGIAKRAGVLVHGRMNVEKALAKGPFALLIEALDASEDGKSSLRNKVKALHLAEFGTETGDVPRLDILSIHDLSLALGTENVVHAALTLDPSGSGAAHARQILDAATRWQNFIEPELSEAQRG